MKTIKKTTLIAAITALAAFAVPSMASAATWAPLNTNKTLTSTNPSIYYSIGWQEFSFTCSNVTLGVHVRTPASSTLDITSASFTGCSVWAGYCTNQNMTVTATGLPWAVTPNGSGGLTFTEHLQVNEQCWPGAGLTVDGPAVGSYNNATHTLTAQAMAPNMKMYSTVLGTMGPIAGTPPYATSFHETTNTLTFS